jgi:hypothetical protein
MFMGLATPWVALDHHSMVARPILVNVRYPCHQHNLEPRPAVLALAGGSFLML